MVCYYQVEAVFKVLESKKGGNKEKQEKLLKLPGEKLSGPIVKRIHPKRRLQLIYWEEKT